MSVLCLACLVSRFSAFLIATVSVTSAFAQSPRDLIDSALQNISALQRPEKVGYATVWDGNKYIQCRRLPDRALRCEAAGTLLQPSMRRVLTAAKIASLLDMGWSLDASFGNFVHVFPADKPTDSIAASLIQVLTDVYAAKLANIELNTDWVVDIPCPPRNGPSQNLAGLINNAPAMRAKALTGCSYQAPADQQRSFGSSAELIGALGPRVSAEIQRLRINAKRNVFTIFDSGIGYIQCMPASPEMVLYCEAQSAESWQALAAVLTPERQARLQKAGYAEPGRGPNYWKDYPFSDVTDAAIAGEILTLLYEVYGYAGPGELKIRAY